MSKYDKGFEDGWNAAMEKWREVIIDIRMDFELEHFADELEDLLDEG